ncbi:hypothetical protein MBANPS3_012050 [Mucor bainieri]
MVEWDAKLAFIQCTKHSISSRKKGLQQGEKEEASQSQEPPSTWKDWKMYMESNIDTFHPFSLAANDIVRAGEGVSGRPNLDENLYRDHLQLKTASRYSLPDELKEYIKAFAAAESDTETKRVTNTMTLEVIQGEDVMIG